MPFRDRAVCLFPQNVVIGLPALIKRHIVIYLDLQVAVFGYSLTAYWNPVWVVFSGVLAFFELCFNAVGVRCDFSSCDPRGVAFLELAFSYVWMGFCVLSKAFSLLHPPFLAFF